MNYLRDVTALPSVNSDVPIIIDYGASTIKAGYAISTEPELVFRSYINKFKDTLTQSNQIATWDTDIFKNYRSPFEKNLIQHSGALENVNDFLFSRLDNGRRDRIIHPVIVTECFASTDLARNILLEQLFECYQVPRVMLGVDSLFAAYTDDLTTYLNQTKLVIHFGDQTVHVVPIIKGQPVYQNIKRLNLGGLNSLKYFYQTVSLRNPHLKFSYAQLDTWHKEYTLVARNYATQLQYFQGQKPYLGYRDRISEENMHIEEELDLITPVIIDIPIVQKVVSVEDLKRKEEIRLKMRARLQESIQQSKLKKRSQVEEQLKQFEIEFQANPSEDLKKKITTLQVKLGIIPKEALEELKYNLLNVPDDKLTPSQLNQKRYQKIMFEQAKQKRDKNQEFKAKQEEAKKFKLDEPEKYLDMLYEKREMICQQINERKKLQQEMTSRNSRFNQKRIQTLAFLGQQEKVEDDFGKDDKDWEIYRSINKELDSEDEKMKQKLQILEAELKELDPEFDTKILRSIQNVHGLGMQLSCVNLSVDRVRCQEIYFQPSMIGVEQQGIIDAIKLSIRELDYRSLLQNVVLTGGGALTKGLETRIQKDLRSEYDCPISVTKASEPVFGAWKGMRNFAMKYPDFVKRFSITLDEYREHSISEIFKLHPFSNIIE